MTPRILFFGMEGVFSRSPLLELIRANHHICAVIVPRPGRLQPIREPIRQLAPPRAIPSDLLLANSGEDPNIIGIAWNAGIDVFQVSSFHDYATTQMIQQLSPTLIVVACFPLLLPTHLITHYPSLNLHPSLLPAYRGPSPLFWVFHDGLEHAGVTIHLMDEHVDTGDIVAQERVKLPDGIRYSSAERLLSVQIARLLVELMKHSTISSFTRTPQAKIPALRAPNPSERDFIITLEWPARRAFNFVRGVGEARLVISEREFALCEAISYVDKRMLGQDLIQFGEFWKVQFSDGVLICRLE